MPKEPNLNKREKELLDQIIERGYVQVDSLNELKHMAKKLEEVFGKSDFVYE